MGWNRIKHTARHWGADGAPHRVNFRCSTISMKTRMGKTARPDAASSGKSGIQKTKVIQKACNFCNTIHPLCNQTINLAATGGRITPALHAQERTQNAFWAGFEPICNPGFTLRQGICAVAIDQVCPHRYRMKILAKNPGKTVLFHRLLAAVRRAVFDHG